MTPKFILIPALTLTFLSTRAVAAPASETIEFCGQTFKLKTKSVSCSGDKDADARLAITDFTALGKLKRLSTLALNRVEVSDLSSLSTLPKLKRLSIRDSELSAPESLGEASNLQRLYIGQTHLSGASTISSCKTSPTQRGFGVDSHVAKRPARSNATPP